MPELNWRVIALAEAAPQRLAILEQMTGSPPNGDPDGLPSRLPRR